MHIINLGTQIVDHELNPFHYKYVQRRQFYMLSGLSQSISFQEPINQLSASNIPAKRWMKQCTGLASK